MLIQRDIQEHIRPWLQRPEITAILGPRQVGKTSLIGLLKNELREYHTVYLDLEDTFNLRLCENVDTFLHFLSGQGWEKGKKVFCFIDEIQYLPDPSKFLKLVHDHHQDIKLIITGSSSFDIRRKFRESLAGRKITFHLLPLSFSEYLRFKNSEFSQLKQSCRLKDIIEQPGLAEKFHIYTEKVLPLFEDFLVFGGFPRIALESESSLRKRLLQELFNTYVLKDIKDLAKIANVLKFNKLVTYLAVQTANLFRFDEAAKELGIAHKTLEHHLFLLENTFILSLIRPFVGNIQKELTKMPKLFFLDNGLRNALINDFRDPALRTDAGLLAENACFAELLKQQSWIEEIRYWRSADGKEIDFIIILEDKTHVPVEVKYKNYVRLEMPTSMNYFIKRYNAPVAIVFTKSTFATRRVRETLLLFLPLWML